MHVTQSVHDQGAAVRKGWVGLGHGGRGMLIYQTGCEAGAKGETWPAAGSAGSPSTASS